MTQFPKFKRDGFDPVLGCSKSHFSKKIKYYVRWVEQLHSFYKTTSHADLTHQQIGDFLSHLSKHCQQWQVVQAGEAIQLFKFFCRKNSIEIKDRTTSTADQWKLTADDFIKMIRLRQLSNSTERTYVTWLRSFYRFVGNKKPIELTSTDFKDFLTHLAAERRVAPSTQNQAFNSILFFYRHILDKEIDGLESTLRARRKKRLSGCAHQNRGKIDFQASKRGQSAHGSGYLRWRPTPSRVSQSAC